MADFAALTDSDSAGPLSELELTRVAGTPGQPHLLKGVAQNLAAAIAKPFRKKAKTVEENANIVIIKVEDYADHRYDRLGRSGMQFIATYVDSDTRSISSRGIGMYRMSFSHFDLAFYIEKEAFVPPSSDDEDDDPRPFGPLPGNGVTCQVKTFEASHGNVYYAGQMGNGVWSYRDTSNLNVRQHIVYEKEVIVNEVMVTYFRPRNGQPRGCLAVGE